MRLSIPLTMAAYLALSAGSVVLLAQPPDVGRSVSQRQSPRSQGMIDYTLGKFNPDNKDFGVRFQSMRAEIVERSIDDLGFWSNVFTLILLAGTTALLYLQWRSQYKRELIAATLMTQLWNGRVSDLLEIEKRTNDYNKLVDLHNAEVERGLMSKPEAVSSSERAESKTRRSVNSLAERSTTVADTQRQVPPIELEPAVSTVPPAEVGPANLQQKVLLQQGQIEAMRNTEQNLKERLNQTTALLEQERKRNQSPKKG
jgi:hypothetical protein